MESGTRILAKPVTREQILPVATAMSIVMILVAAIPLVETERKTKMRIVTRRLSLSLIRLVKLVIRAKQTVRVSKNRPPRQPRGVLIRPLQRLNRHAPLSHPPIRQLVILHKRHQLG